MSNENCDELKSDLLVEEQQIKVMEEHDEKKMKVKEKEVEAHPMNETLEKDHQSQQHLEERQDLAENELEVRERETTI